MGVKNLQIISDALIKHGKPASTPAALVRWGTTPKQVSLISTLGEIPGAAKKKGIKAPAIFLVGSVAQLHDSLGWFEKKPLFGKRVLVTRGREQSRKAAEKIVEQGGEPVLFPTIQIAPPTDFQPLDDAINNVSSYDWIIFTSVNGVDRFFQRFFEIREDIRDLAGPKIGAIGPITAAGIRDRGLKVNLLAKEFVAEGVLELLNEIPISGKKFLIPRAEKARDVLPEGITAKGGIVDVVTVYRTVMPEASGITEVVDMLQEKAIDVVTFTSSSTVTHFLEMLRDFNVPELLDGVALASIGPVTSETLRQNGLTVSVEAKEYTIDGLIEAVAKLKNS